MSIYVRRATLWVLILWIGAAASGAVPEKPAVPENPDALPDTVYLLTFYRWLGDGLLLAYSLDGRKWRELEGTFLQPEKVGGGIIRDPHILRGPDGVFHMVWMSGLHDNGIGYAWSRDLIQWSEQRELPVMANVPGTQNCWAPETFYDARRKQFIITWSSEVEGRFPETDDEFDWNHRTYYVTTPDFKTFSEPQLLFDTPFAHIDATLLERDGKYLALIKACDRPKRHLPGPIYVAVADDPLGPYTLQEDPILVDYALAQTPLEVDGETLLIVIYYKANRFGLFATRDWRTWRDISDEAMEPLGCHPARAMAVPRPVVQRLIEYEQAKLKAPRSLLPGFTANPAIQVFGDRYYLYHTVDWPDQKSTKFVAGSSPNLIDWKRDGVVLDLAKDLTWVDAPANGATCVERDGAYYFYFGAGNQIGVAIGRSPTGPFKDGLGRPLVQKDGNSREKPLTPNVFIDDDQRAYLYVGNGDYAQAYKLKPDLISIDGDPVSLALRYFNSDLVVFKRQGKYYFLWSIDDPSSPNCRVGWGMAESPLGPVRSPEGSDFIVLKRTGLVEGTARHSVINVPGTDRWYLAYDRHAIPDGNAQKRQIALLRLEFTADGALEPLDPLKPAFAGLDIGEPLEDGVVLKHRDQP